MRERLRAAFKSPPCRLRVVVTWGLVAAVCSVNLVVSPVSGDDSPQSLDALISALRGEDLAERRDGAYELARLGSEAAEAIPDLIAALDDSDNQVWM